ncbi:MAG: hypothetical protein J6C15_02135 [Bacteroidaceae bacterium]|nr:hypothetical protein [Bacteroidaceae bacterium]
MSKIEIINAYVEGNSIHYQIREDKGLGLLQHEVVDIFIRYHGDEHFDCDLSQTPLSVLMIPISLYMLPITYFFDIELVIPVMDKDLYSRLSAIYKAYSKVYGPFNEEWRGKLSIGEIIETKPVNIQKYDKVVFFSGGVDACHAGIDNPGRKSLLVSIPDIERDAKIDGPLREEKFSLIKKFSKVVDSDWILISNNFNASLFKDNIIGDYLTNKRGLCSNAYYYDGWGGIRYLANMCCVAPVAYLTGVEFLVMGATFEQIEDKLLINYDGASPELSDVIGFANISFSEQDALMVRRSKKVCNIIEWCKKKGITTKMWACFSDGTTQCGYCVKCLRTQLNILCAGENPKDWGFDNFNPDEFTKLIKSYRYCEANPCWVWDNIEAIKDEMVYPYCNELLHWLKLIGYKEYHTQSLRCARRQTMYRRLTSFRQYSHYLKVAISRLIGNK